ncbi:MAG: M42 family metallopeptidase [Anaerolineae bacterium]|jgi:putative aminopeptidase FrvX
MDVVELLRDLSTAHGVSGYEAQILDVVRRAYEPNTDEIRSDSLGNLIGLRRGQRPEGAPVRSIMLAAHTDEIGLMVTGFEKGFIRFTNVGGVDVRTILGQEVLVHGRRPLIGIIGSHPPHVTPPEERNKPIPMDKLFIDVGLTEERLHQEVRVGDMITMRRDFLSLAEGYVSGKSFDDRAGVVSLALCLEMLAGMRHEWDVYAVATSQEEVGLRGAQVSAYGIAPDIAIAVDVGFGAQQGVSENESIAMDGGPAIAMGPNIHPAMYERLVAIARDHELKYQTEVAAGATGTDAWAIQVARSGIPCGLLSIPLRYMHTSVETICIRDIERTARLMALFIAGLDENFASALPL